MDFGLRLQTSQRVCSTETKGGVTQAHVRVESGNVRRVTIGALKTNMCGGGRTTLSVSEYRMNERPAGHESPRLSSHDIARGYCTVRKFGTGRHVPPRRGNYHRTWLARRNGATNCQVSSLYTSWPRTQDASHATILYVNTWAKKKLKLRINDARRSGPLDSLKRVHIFPYGVE